LDFTRKLLKKDNPQLSYVDGELLSEVGDIDIRFASDYLREWVLDDNVAPKMQDFFYPKVVYSLFKNHEDELIEFMENLTTFGSKFEILINKTMSEMMFDLRLNFDSELELHKKTTARDLKNLLKGESLDAELATLHALNLDDLSGKISKALDIIDRYQIPETHQNYQMLEYQKKQLHSKLEFLKSKGSLVTKCLHILEQISQERNINYLRLTENFRSEKLCDVMRNCEILVNEIFKAKVDDLDYAQLSSKLKFFPNIEKFLGYNWLEGLYTVCVHQPVLYG
jgi:hypothetical protein